MVFIQKSEINDKIANPENEIFTFNEDTRTNKDEKEINNEIAVYLTKANVGKYIIFRNDRVDGQTTEYTGRQIIPALSQTEERIELSSTDFGGGGRSKKTRRTRSRSRSTRRHGRQMKSRR